MKVPEYNETITIRDPFNPSKTVKSVVSSTLVPLSNVKVKRGKVKDVYDLGEHLVLYFTDRVSAFDSILKDPIPYKGVYLCASTVFWFKETSHIFPNHFIEQFGDRCIKTVKAERIDIEWIIRGYLYGSAWRAYSKGVKVVSGVKIPNGLSLAEELPEPILTPTTKSDVGHDIEISREEAISEKLVDRDEWRELEEACFKLYEYYRWKAKSCGLILADVKLEFGRFREGLIQIDEPLTHDTARIWPVEYYEPGRPQYDYCLDKEFLRAYLKSVGFKASNTQLRLPWPVIEQVALRVKGSYEVLTGKCKIRSLNLKSLSEVLAEVEGETFKCH